MVLDRAKGQSHDDGAVKPHLLKWVKSYRDHPCKRVILDQYLDGREDRTDCETEEEACERCERKNADSEEDAEAMGNMSMDFSEPLFMAHETPFASSATNASDQVFSPVNVNAGVAQHQETNHELPTRIRQAEEGSTRSSDPLAVGTQSFMNSAAARVSHGVSQSVSAGIVARHQQQVQETQAQIRQLRAACDSVRGRCAYCYITAQPQGANRFMYRCTQEQCGPIKAGCYAKKKRLRAQKELAPYGGCTLCFLPQAWCNRWREKAGAGIAGIYQLVPEERFCDHQDVAMEMLTVLLQVEPEFRQQMQTRMPANMDWKDVTRYWGQRVQWGGIDTYRMVVELSKGLQLQNQQ